MNQVAKLVIIGPNDTYLMLYRNQHPRFGNDADIPGGSVEAGEQPIEGMLREVKEEIGIVVQANVVQKIYEGTRYGKLDVEYLLYSVTLTTEPQITLSWEHSGYEWLSRNDFLTTAQNAQDSFMHMVYDRIK